MMEAVHTSEKSVNFNVTTWHYVPENSKLHTCHRENLKSHKYLNATYDLEYTDFPNAFFAVLEYRSGHDIHLLLMKIS
jgi:hypothetical protein